MKCQIETVGGFYAKLDPQVWKRHKEDREESHALINSVSHTSKLSASFCFEGSASLVFHSDHHGLPLWYEVQSTGVAQIQFQLLPLIPCPFPPKGMNMLHHNKNQSFEAGN
jgi:hypothetical protein